MRLAYTAYLVREYDEAIDWFTAALGWNVTEDVDMGGGKRWVRTGGSTGSGLLLARAATAEQTTAVGKAAGGRVAYFLHSRDFNRDHARMIAAGVQFTETPRDEPYGRVAVFIDFYGNKWDLIGPNTQPLTDTGEVL